MLFFRPFFTGAGVGAPDGVADGDGDGTLVFFDVFGFPDGHKRVFMA